jgi:hypothetical protein
MASKTKRRVKRDVVIHTVSFETGEERYSSLFGTDEEATAFMCEQILECLDDDHAQAGEVRRMMRDEEYDEAISLWNDMQNEIPAGADPQWIFYEKETVTLGGCKDPFKEVKRLLKED